jgi:hypothetical protein
MFHQQAFNHVIQYFANAREKKQEMLQEEEAFIERRRFATPASILARSGMYGLSTYLVFRFPLKTYSIHASRRFFIAGSIFWGALIGVRQSGHRFLIDFIALPNSKVAFEARELIRKDNPNHPLLLEAESRMNKLTSPTSVSSSFEEPIDFATDRPNFQQADAFVDESTTAAAAAGPKDSHVETDLPVAASKPFHGKLHLPPTTNKELDEHVDAFSQDATWLDEDTNKKPTIGNRTMTWEDIRREYEQKKQH